MDCKTARLLLDFARPRTPELEADETEVLETHLAECPECGTLAQVERQADERLRLAMQDVTLPEDLRGRLLTRLDAERRLWYWRLPRRHPRAAAAVAALFLFAVGLMSYWLMKPLPVISLDKYLEDENIQAQREDVEQWFAERGVKIVAPRGFKYSLLDSYGFAEVAGKRAPHLLFVGEPNQGRTYLAHVYILSAGQFDLKASLTQPRVGSGKFTVELRPNPDDPKTAYLLKYTGGSLDWLLENEDRPGDAAMRQPFGFMPLMLFPENAWIVPHTQRHPLEIRSL